MKWLAGYGSFLDWYLVPATDENRQIFDNACGDEYESFAEAKRALMQDLRQRIRADQHALKNIRAKRKPNKAD